MRKISFPLNAAALLSLVSLISFIAMACSNRCPAPAEDRKSAQNSAPVCSIPQPADAPIYETWDEDSGLAHMYAGGLFFDPGAHNAAKYLDRSSVTPWLPPEYISAESAAADRLDWADSGRFARWLAAPSGTVHFPFFPDEWTGDLSVEAALRPKNNPSMAVRFYKPDGKGGRVWSEPLTADISPGYSGYRWNVPRDFLSSDGMQLMRFSFPGTYFEGESRVSAKFVSIGFGPNDKALGKFKISPELSRLHQGDMRVLEWTMRSWRMIDGDRLDRFMVIPEKAALRFYAAPSAYLDSPGKLSVSVSYDADEKVETQMLDEITLSPGDCWHLRTIDLSEYAGQAVRLSIRFTGSEDTPVFTAQTHDDAWISSPQIVLSDDGGLSKARDEMAKAQRIVVIAVDNLRADRLLLDAKRRAVPELGHLADDGILGVLMGESLSHAAMTASFLTAVSADVHKVTAPGTHLRTLFTTIAEAASPKGWKSYFFSTSGIIDAAHGFAQGFDEIHQLNKDNITEARQALPAIASSLAASPEHSLYYVHLSELRLPHRISEEKLNLWGVAGYSGPVGPAAMMNTAVMRDPGLLDARQFEAYYDGELSEIDTAFGEFINRLPEDTLLVIYGTHGCSLGESTLGYEQSLSPWELLTPFVITMPGHPMHIRRPGIARASELSGAVLDIIGADLPANLRTVFELHDSRPSAQNDGLSASASDRNFYRIRREAVDTLLTTGLDGNPAREYDTPQPIAKQAMREKID